MNRTLLRPVAALEYKYCYNVLLFDFRGHGESESVATSGGNAEIHDLEAALTVASQQPETLPGKIVIHGFSMGASIALLTDPHPDVAAIVVDSPMHAWTRYYNASCTGNSPETVLPGRHFCTRCEMGSTRSPGPH